MKLKIGRVEILFENSYKDHKNLSVKKLDISRYLKDRYKYYLVSYLLSYIIFMIHLLPSYKEWTYQTIFPIKIFYFCISLLLGNLFYYLIEEADWVKEYGHYTASARIIKYIIFMVLIIFIFTKTQQCILSNYNIDIEWLMGI